MVRVFICGETALSVRVVKFFSYYKPYLRLFFVDVTCAVIVAAIALILPLCARYITHTVLETQPLNALSQIYTMGAVMLGLLLIQTLCNTFVDYQGHMMGTLMESDMRADLFDHYQKMSPSFYDEQKTGQLMSRITNDLFAVSELYHHGPEESIIAILKFVGAFVILIQINVGLTLIVFLFVPIMTVYAIYFNRRISTAWMRSSERIGDIHAQVEDALSGIRVVKSFTNEDAERQKFARANARFVQSRDDGYRNEAYFYGGMIALTESLSIAVIIFGGAAIVNANLALADLLTYLLFIAILIDPVHKFVNLARLYHEGITGFRRFMEIMEQPPEIQDAPNAIELSDVAGHVTFKKVCFQYKQNLNYVLKDVSLTIHAGEYVALVGSSGVGKSTLCALISRFYEVTDGEILLDGHNIQDLRLASLRANIGVVQQDVYLFAGTVADNIRYGKLDAPREAIIQAAQQANAHDFIMALPNGYDTDIGQRGVKLSGGQKQRLSIARVFLKDPPVIIFDEATSALDNESEKAVQASLERLTHHRTMIVIAHRLSTIRNAQRIIVLGDNGVDEQGTHEELIRLGGTYAALYNIQFTT